MPYIAVRCPHCQRDHIVKHGTTRRGTQRYLCQNTACVQGSFLLDYRNRGGVPEVKQHIIDMSLNASGIRDSAPCLFRGPQWTTGSGARCGKPPAFWLYGAQ